MNIPTSSALTAFVSLCLSVPPASAQIWTQTSAPLTNWTSVASSADGTKLVAVSDRAIYTSADSGVTWTPTSAPVTNWISVASSADGTKLVAAVAVFMGSQYETGGPIYVSADSGVTWTATDAPSTNWSSVASSADGSKLVAVSGGYVVYVSSTPPGPIFTSTNSGATWTGSLSSANCTSVASSADGIKLVAVEYGGPIYSSTDSGATWAVTNPPFAYLVSIASSADGTKLVAGTWDPFHPPGSGGAFNVFTSTNSGATWGQAPVGDIGRGLVASSADGTRLVAAAGANAFGRSGPIFTSADSGMTWTNNGAPVAAWSSVASSADGGKLVAVVRGGGIWTCQSPPAPKLNLTRPGSNVIISWIVPSMNFALQENSDLNTTNWMAVTSAPALNLTNLQYQVLEPLSVGSRFYRLKH